jgi:hypothetical protein
VGPTPDSDLLRKSALSRWAIVPPTIGT